MKQMITGASKLITYMVLVVLYIAPVVGFFYVLNDSSRYTPGHRTVGNERCRRNVDLSIDPDCIVLVDGKDDFSVYQVIFPIAIVVGSFWYYPVVLPLWSRVSHQKQVRKK